MGIDKKALTNDLLKWAETFANAYAEKGAEELTKATELAIAGFYDSYQPLYYDRTYDLMKNSYKKYMHNNGKVVYGGVKISTDNMQPYGKTSPETVLSMTFFNGYHGGITKEYTGSMYYQGKHYTPSPYYSVYDVVTNIQKNPKFEKTLIDYATTKASQQKYSVLSKVL